MSAHESTDGAVVAHVSSWKLYVGILGVLLLLTLATVGVYQIHLGAANLAIAVLIATMKASLVVLYFMHLKYDTRFNALVFIGALLFMGLFLAYTLADTEYRGSIDPQYGTKYDVATGEVAGGMADELSKEIERDVEEGVRAPKGERQVVPPQQPVPVLQVVPTVPPAPAPAPASDADAGVGPDGATAEPPAAP